MDLLEKLAALEHEKWSGWLGWMFEKWDAVHPSGELYRDRWRRQMNTPYERLSEQEKESDRIEARRVLNCVIAWAAAWYAKEGGKPC